MSKKVYITYPNSDAKTEWTGYFLSKLESVLNRVEPHTYGLYTKAIHFEEENYREHLETASTVILLVDDKHDYYPEELQAISDKLKANSENGSQSFNVVKIWLAPKADKDLPYNIQELPAHKMFRIARSKRIIRHSFEQYNVESWSVLVDVATSFSGKRLFSTSEKQSIKLYMGNCTADVEFKMKELQRELQEHGIQLTSASYKTPSLETNTEKINEALHSCNGAIQILGEDYGEQINGAVTSIPDFENKQISLYQNEHDNFERFIWIPSGIKIQNSKQELFVNRIRRNESKTNTFIIESTIEDIKSKILRTYKSKVDKHIERKHNTLYYISPQPISEQYKQLLEGRGLQIVNPAKQSGNIYQAHLKTLQEVDYIIINWSNFNNFWLNSKLSDIVKSIGLGKSSNHKAIGIITNQKPELGNFEELLSSLMIMPELNDEHIEAYL